MNPEERAEALLDECSKIRSWWNRKGDEDTCEAELRREVIEQIQEAESSARKEALEEAIGVVEAEVNSYIPKKPARGESSPTFGAYHVCRSRLAGKIQALMEKPTNVE